MEKVAAGLAPVVEWITQGLDALAQGFDYMVQKAQETSKKIRDAADIMAGVIAGAQALQDAMDQRGYLLEPMEDRIYGQGGHVLPPDNLSDWIEGSLTRVQYQLSYCGEAVRCVLGF